MVLMKLLILNSHPCTKGFVQNTRITIATIKSGCGNCLVIEGNMKAHRKICKKKGCTLDPMHRSLFCKNHSDSITRDVKEEKQVLLSENEFHIEKIVKKVRSKKGKWLYEVSWIGFDKHTMEPRENIPRILVELFERFGDSNVSTKIVDHLEIQGIKYIKVACKDENSGNTEKTKSRFYQRTGGVLVMAKPCGIIVSLVEIFGGESVSQVAEVIEDYLENCLVKPRCLVYDDACHLKRHVDCRMVYPLLQQEEMKIDRFHFQNHVDSWCRQNMDPSKSIFLKDVNTEVMEQIFAWIKGYVPSLRYMNSFNFRFFLLDMIDRQNMELSDS